MIHKAMERNRRHLGARLGSWTPPVVSSFRSTPFPVQFGVVFPPCALAGCERGALCRVATLHEQPVVGSNRPSPPEEPPPSCRVCSPGKPWPVPFLLAPFSPRARLPSGPARAASIRSASARVHRGPPTLGPLLWPLLVHMHVAGAFLLGFDVPCRLQTAIERNAAALCDTCVERTVRMRDSISRVDRKSRRNSQGGTFPAIQARVHHQAR
mmetsp:Transcript_4859/g.31069  ORF Transcript_4859/g.31069 Transcript_4859/m.31069 type:complete len:211 (-) Transcript_4859:1371-2003(-)